MGTLILLQIYSNINTHWLPPCPVYTEQTQRQGTLWSSKLVLTLIDCVCGVCAYVCACASVIVCASYGAWVGSLCHIS